MKMNLASHSFAVLTAALMMVGAVGCSTAPIAQDPPAAEMPPTVDSVSSSTSSADSMTNSAPDAAPVIQDSTPVADVPAPSSLGASSSGRGH